MDNKSHQAFSSYHSIPEMSGKEETSLLTAQDEERSAPTVSSSSSIASKIKGCTQTFLKLIITKYCPCPDATAFLERLQSKSLDGVEVQVAVLTAPESSRYFGVPLAKRGIQPVWIEIENNSSSASPLFLDLVTLQANYYPAREAAQVCHFCSLKQLLGQGFLSWLLFLPLALLLPLRMLTAGPANRRMEEFFVEHQFPNKVIEAGDRASGFVFTSLDCGTKAISIHLLSSTATKKFNFMVPVPGLAVDFEGRNLNVKELYPESSSVVDCTSLSSLREILIQEPRAVFNRRGTKEGDPVNLVIVGDFSTLFAAFGARWDETEVINLKTCIKTAKSFVLGSQYRYSPVSALYLYGRSQDFALQRARSKINERLHLRLWLMPMTYEGTSVWIGQVSRDIGVRLAKTWNLTTHRIDPDVDEARNYVAADLLKAGHLECLGMVKGVGVSKKENPRRNLTGDPFVTDGKRMVLCLSPTKTSESAKLIDW